MVRVRSRVSIMVSCALSAGFILARVVRVKMKTVENLCVKNNGDG